MKRHVRKNVIDWTVDEMNRVQHDKKLTPEERERTTLRLQGNLERLRK
jgi:hypothetical protein